LGLKQLDKVAVDYVYCSPQSETSIGYKLVKFYVIAGIRMHCDKTKHDVGVAVVAGCATDTC